MIGNLTLVERKNAVIVKSTFALSKEISYIRCTLTPSGHTSQQYRAWSDCTNVQAGLALYWWQSLLLVVISMGRVKIKMLMIFQC